MLELQLSNKYNPFKQESKRVSRKNSTPKKIETNLKTIFYSNSFDNLSLSIDDISEPFNEFMKNKKIKNTVMEKILTYYNCNTSENLLSKFLSKLDLNLSVSIVNNRNGICDYEIIDSIDLTCNNKGKKVNKENYYVSNNIIPAYVGNMPKISKNTIKKKTVYKDLVKSNIISFTLLKKENLFLSNLRFSNKYLVDLEVSDDFKSTNDSIFNYNRIPTFLGIIKKTKYEVLRKKRSLVVDLDDEIIFKEYINLD